MYQSEKIGVGRRVRRYQGRIIATMLSASALTFTGTLPPAIAQSDNTTNVSRAPKEKSTNNQERRLITSLGKRLLVLYGNVKAGKVRDASASTQPEIPLSVSHTESIQILFTGGHSQVEGSDNDYNFGLQMHVGSDGKVQASDTELVSMNVGGSHNDNEFTLGVASIHLARDSRTVSEFSGTYYGNDGRSQTLSVGTTEPGKDYLDANELKAIGTQMNQVIDLAEVHAPVHFIESPIPGHTLSSN